MSARLLILPLFALVAAAWGGENTDSNVTSPGRKRPPRRRFLERVPT
jgi:hypothetical protein